MAPKISEEYLEDRRNQILDATVVTFSRKGLHQTTIENIRMAADLSRGAVYHYFKTNEEIIDGIRQRSTKQAEIVLALGNKSNDVESTLVDLVDATRPIMGSDKSVEANRLAMLLWAESLVNERIMEGQLPAFPAISGCFGGGGWQRARGRQT